MPGGCGPTRIGTRELSATGFGLLFRLNKEKFGMSGLSLPTNYSTVQVGIRINLSCWIRIRIRIQVAVPDPDPGGQK